MWRGDERMEEVKEVCPLFRIPTLVEPIYNENSGCWRLWWNGRKVVRYQLLDLILQRLLENGGIGSDSFQNGMVKCWNCFNEMGNDRGDKGRFSVKAWDSR
jgi:hypothetical protein